MSEEIPTSVEFLDILAKGIAQREGLPAPVSDYRLAKVLGVTTPTISKIRTGKTTLGTGVMERIAAITGVPYEWVLTCIQVERAQNVAARNAWTKAAQKLAMCLMAVGFMTIFLPHSDGWAAGDVNAHYEIRIWLV